MENSKTAQGDLFPISTVAEITGVNPVTLRAWERRYGVICPSRTDKGRRLYSQTEVEKIHTLLNLLEQGITISRAAEALQHNEQTPQTQEARTDTWQAYIQRMMTAIGLFNENLLDETYTDAIALYPIDIVTQKLLMPLLDILGERWDKHKSGVAEEHFFSMYLRNKLGARFHHQNRFATGAPIILAGLPGERHEFGLLLLALNMMNYGHRIVLLGPDLPLEQLTPVVESTGAKAIVLSGSTNSDFNKITDDLNTLLGNCRVPVFLGGSICDELAQDFHKGGLTILGNDIRQGVVDLQKTLDE